MQPMLLAGLQEKNLNVACWCHRCFHHAILSTNDLVARLGATMPVPEIGVYLRCSGCGCKDVATQPDWPSQGVVARHME